MNRTSKALARLGTGAVVAATFLAMPFAIGSASADPSFAGGTLQASGTAPSGTTDTITTAYGTAAPNSATQNTVTTGQATLYVYHQGAALDNLTLTLTGSSGTGYFPTAGQAGNVTVVDATHATCTTVADTFGNTDCAINVADTASEALVVTAGDTTDPAHPSTSGNVSFNGLHWSQCGQTGNNTYANCTTQGSVNTPTTTSFTYLEGGTPAANKNIQVNITGGAGQFSGTQPTGTSFFSLTQVNCTTDASGKCSVTVVDATANNTTDLSATTGNPAPYPAATAQEAITFQAASVAPSEIDLDKSIVIAPASQPNGQLAEPGDVIQNTYTLRGAPVPVGTGSPVCTTNPVCQGVPLANTTFSLKVSDGFFTPNCVSPAATSVSGVASGINNYANCTFNTAPAAGKPVGDLKDGGQSIDLKTDAGGQVVVSLGIGKDAGFDDDGTVVAAVSDGSIVPQVEGDTNSPSSTTCAASTSTYDPAVGSPGNVPANVPGVPGALPGCNIDTAWTTNEAPLNGATAKDVVVPAIRNPNNNFIATENNDTATDSGTNNVPDVDRVVFAVHLTDQFGNLTSNAGAPLASIAGIQKTGPGNLVGCKGFTAVNACTGPEPIGVAFPGATQPDGTVTQQGAAVGSYTNNDPAVQFRYEADANTALSTSVVDCYPGSCGNTGVTGTSGNPGVNDGTQTDTTGWYPEVTNFASFIAGSPAFATYAPQSAAATPSVDTLTINFYNQLAQAVVTFGVKPGHKVPTSTAVTVTGTVTDQFKNPIVNAAMQIVRSGANESSCTPIQDTNANQFVFTNQAGKGGYTFSCNQAGASTVNIVVTGPGGTQLAAGKEVIHFTGNSAHLTKEKPKLHLSSKNGHVTVHIKTKPAVHGKTVNIYRLKHGLPHLIGAAKTGHKGAAHLKFKAKAGKKLHIEVKVQGLKATKYNSRFSKTKTIKVKG